MMVKSLAVRLVASALGGVALAPLLATSPVLAQVELNPSTVQPLQDFKPQESQNRDPFSGTNSGQSGLFELLHRANFGNIRSTTEFNADQRSNLENAASEFRKRQLQLLKSAPQTAPAPISQPGAVPVNAPAAGSK
ncbi:MAG: hypothetical protein SFW36_07490 [Leptolyngbyaceae cyanobacterium bins.59]|nr:hypothetical protein [Leptolyngbyaceae cyanobacterium bins.59]